jgi:hypothetical protein
LEALKLVSPQDCTGKYHGNATTIFRNHITTAATSPLQPHHYCSHITTAATAQLQPQHNCNHSTTATTTAAAIESQSAPTLISFWGTFVACSTSHMMLFHHTT